MAELISMTYEQARAEHFKALKDEAKRKMNYWATRVRHSRPNDLNDPAHIKASEYGAEYSYYKDALEALAAQPKWISATEFPRLDPDRTWRCACEFSIDVIGFDGQNIFKAYYNFEDKVWLNGNIEEESHNITHWMYMDNLPEPPKEDE